MLPSYKRTEPDFSQISRKLEHELLLCEKFTRSWKLCKVLKTWKTPVAKVQKRGFATWPATLAIARIMWKATTGRCLSSKKIYFLLLALFPLTALALGPEEVGTNTHVSLCWIWNAWLRWLSMWSNWATQIFTSYQTSPHLRWAGWLDLAWLVWLGLVGSVRLGLVWLGLVWLGLNMSRLVLVQLMA